jgi:fucose permease
MPCGLNAVAPEALREAKSEVPSMEWEARRWIRVLAFFAINVCTVGLQFSYASLLAHFEQAFSSESRSTLASVGAVSLGVMDLSAVISGLLITRLGARATCAFGGALAGVGLLLCSAASDIWGLIATYGGLYPVCFRYGSQRNERLGQMT